MAVADYCVRDSHGQWAVTRREYADPVHLWADVAAFARPKRRTVLWAHNLDYDVRIARALTILPDMGWRLADLRLSRFGSWFKWTDNGRSLVMADSYAHLPRSLDIIGATLGYGKPALPVAGDDAAWAARCHADVTILSAAVRLYLDWLRVDDMGSWHVTGAGQSWAAWRHKHYTHPILVSDDLDCVDAERRALWAGRVEAWRWGTDDGARVYDYDWTCAYARIAADTDIPVRQWATGYDWTLDSCLRAAETRAVLAEVTVTTDTPVAPAELAGRIVWPVGTFGTILWDPELRLLAETGAQVTVHRAWVYRRAPALAAWGTWILDALADRSGDVPEWRKIALKLWSRALIGRFAMRYQPWEHIGQVDEPALELSAAIDAETDRRYDILTVGRDVFESGQPVASNDYAPMVTGYIQSEARARLWRATQQIGPEHVLYVATDSMLLDTVGDRAAHRLLRAGELDGLRCKRKYTGWEIGGPQQVVLGGEPRIAGLAAGAVRLTDSSWSTEVWQTLPGAIRQGHATTVTVTPRTYRARAVDARRVRRPDGRTEPIRLPLNGLGADGGDPAATATLGDMTDGVAAGGTGR